MVKQELETISHEVVKQNSGRNTPGENVCFCSTLKNDFLSSLSTPAQERERTT